MEIENLEIIIDSDTERAAKGLQKLKRVLKSLDSDVEQSGLKKLHERLRGIASVNLTKQARALERIVKASKQLNTERKRKIADSAATEPKAAETPVSSLSGTTEQVGRLERIKMKSRDIANEWKKLRGHVEDTGKSAQKAGKSLSAMTAIKTILMYSVLFSALNAVTKGIKEGLDNVTRASKEANEVMTQYRTTTLQMKNALGAAAIPTLKRLYPLFRLLANGIINVANSVNILTSALSGSKTYTRATEYVDDYVRTLEKAKGLLGMDEINTMGKSASFDNMFEEVELGVTSVVGAIGHVTALTSGILLLNAAIKGITWTQAIGGLSKFASGLKNGLSNVKAFSTSLPPLVKGLIGIGGILYGLKLTTDGAYDLSKALHSGTREGLGDAVLSMVSGGAMAVVGGFSVGGPIGALIGGCIALAGAIWSIRKASIELGYEILKTSYYDIQGKKISDVRDALNEYFSAMDFQKQQDWIDRMRASQRTYEAACFAYDNLWSALRKKTVFDTTDIENLTQAFEDLTKAARDLNSAHFGSLMSSIATSIKMNFTPDLNKSLGDLLEKINQMKIMIEGEFADLSTQYRQILSDIAQNGGAVSDEQKKQLSEIRNNLSSFTLSDDTSSVRWESELKNALNQKINAGDSKDAVLSNVKDLVKDKDAYLNTLYEQYLKDKNTLQQLIRIDSQHFGGALGFSSADLNQLENAYTSKVAQVNKEYDDVLQQIIKTYSSQIGQIDDSVIENALKEKGFWAQTVAEVRNFWSSFFRDENGKPIRYEYEKKKMLEEHEALIEELKKYLSDSGSIPGYAVGGFPEDGLFLANHTELVGKFANGKTAVANNEQIIEGISRGVSSATSEQNSLLREQNQLLRQIASMNPTVSVSTITKGIDRLNRRSGRDIVATNY